MFEKCKEERKRDQARAQWNALLPFMNLELLKYISFEEYFDRITGANLDQRPAAEILKEVEEIRKQMRAENESV